MTTKEYLQSKEPNIHIIPEEFLQEYAKIKCKELLEIVAEKAVLALNGEIYSKTYSAKVYNERIKLSIDKNSILNAVDLEIFC